MIFFIIFDDKMITIPSLGCHIMFSKFSVSLKSQNSFKYSVPQKVSLEYARKKLAEKPDTIVQAIDPGKINIGTVLVLPKATVKSGIFSASTTAPAVRGHFKRRR